MRSLGRVASVYAIAQTFGQALALNGGIIDKRDVLITNVLGCDARGPFPSDRALEIFACTDGAE